VTGARARGVPASGVVTAFDVDEGLGRITLDGGDVVTFHATQLADGSRTVDVGRCVVLTVVPWHLGRREGADVTGACADSRGVTCEGRPASVGEF
jgi:hypothetical protein